MSLTERQIVSLQSAIANYAFPPVYFDFCANSKVEAKNMTEVESYIRKLLISDDQQNILYGLANVLYWGYAQIGYRDVRVNRFLADTNGAHLSEFKLLTANGIVPTLSAIKKIGIPQFSGISFISKVLAFLDPDKYCVLDQQLARLATGNSKNALNQLKQGQQIRVTKNNEESYDFWRKECTAISMKYFDSRYRVVDIERGFFHLVQTDQLLLAQRIYENS